jgi:hypothetical protein
MIKYIKASVLFLIFACLIWYSFAQHGRWWDRWSDPMQIFESIVDDANKWWYAIQETALDGVTDLEWSYSREFKITNTLDYLRKNLDPYLQRAVYVWLVLATVALIYSWFLLVTHWIHKAGDWTKVKTNVMYALLWVFLLSWFYFIIKIMVSLITSIFWWSTWDSWF